MSPLELQTVRDSILRWAGRYNRGITRQMLADLCTASGLELAADGPNSLDAQVKYLLEKNFLREVPKPHTPSFRIFELTSDGEDYLRKG